MTYSSHGDLGDVLAGVGPVMLNMGPGELVLCRGRIRVRDPFTPEKVERCRSFFECQSYITGVKHANHPTGFALDGWRHRIRRKRGEQLTITDWHTRAAKLPDWPHERTWFEVDTPKPVSRYVINRTSRYHSSAHHPWGAIVKQYGDEAVFCGTQMEWRSFCNQFGMVPYFETKTLLDLARCIAGAERIFCNQSTCCWLSLGLGRPMWLEEWERAPNCRFVRQNVINGPTDRKIRKLFI